MIKIEFAAEDIRALNYERYHHPQTEGIGATPGKMHSKKKSFRFVSFKTRTNSTKMPGLIMLVASKEED